MTTEKVNDLEVVSLKTYFKPSTFRLIPADASWAKGGISEVPVSLNLHAEFYKTLSFDIHKLQKLFGFSIMGEKLAEINQGPYYSQERKGILKEIELNDSGELWIIKLEFFDGSKKLYAVKAEEVSELLNQCRKPLIIN